MSTPLRVGAYVLALVAVLAAGLGIGRLVGDVGDDETVAALLEVHARGERVAERERRVVMGFAAAHPRVRRVEVPGLATDVHDLDGLEAIGDLLGSPSTGD